MAADSVKILYKGGTAETEVKKSRFIANLKPVESEEEATAFIAEMKKKYWDARHNCTAFTIGSPIAFTFNGAMAHLFDRNTKKNLEWLEK